MRADSLEAVHESTLLSKLKDKYEAGGGNLSAWAAIQFCITKGKPLPEWVSEYLLGTSNNLLAINKPKRRAAELVFEAIGIKGHEFTGPPDHSTTFLIIEGMIKDGYTPAAAYRKHAKQTGGKVNSIKKHHLDGRKKWLAFLKEREEKKNRI